MIGDLDQVEALPEVRQQNALRTHLPAIIVWIILTLAIYLVGGIYIDRIRSEAIESAMARATEGAMTIEQVLLRSVGGFAEINALIQVRADLLSKGNNEGASAISQHLMEIASSKDSGIVGIDAVGPDARSTWSTFPGGHPSWVGDQGFVTLHRGGKPGIAVTLINDGPQPGVLAMAISQPLTSPKHAFNGVAVVLYDLAQLSKTLSELQFGPNAVSSVWSTTEPRLIASSANSPQSDAQGKTREEVQTPEPSKGTDRVLQASHPIAGLPLIATVTLDRMVELKNANMVAAWVNLTCAGLTLLTGALQILVAIMSARKGAKLELSLARRQAELAVSAQRRIALLLSGLPAAVYAGRIRYDGSGADFTMTETVRRLTGWDLADLPTRRQWTEKALGMNARDWQSYYEKIATTGDGSVEYQFQHRDGSIIWLRDEARAIARPTEDEVTVVGYVSDSTREHRLREQAISASKLATLGEMATGLAHELNQPVATMSLAAENAANQLKNNGAGGIAFAIQRMTRIVQQAARARTIIDHLRIFGRHNREELRPVSLHEVLDGALHLAGSALKASSINVEVVLAKNLPLVLAEPVMAEHVLVNLLLNAKDAMEGNPEDRPRRVVISGNLGQDGETVLLSIEDNGPGIPPAIAERIFEPFFTTKAVGKGTGLGLSLCHGIMSSFSGSIEAANAPSGGALFIATSGAHRTELLLGMAGDATRYNGREP